MEKPQKIVFDSRDFKTDEEMITEIGKVASVLLKINYSLSIRHDDMGIYVLEFDYDDRVKDYGTTYLRWVDAEEWEDFLSYKEYLKNDESEEV